MRQDRKEWFDSVAASAPDWVGRRVMLSVGSEQAVTTFVTVEGVVERAIMVPEGERASAEREMHVLIRADETVVLNLVEDTCHEGDAGPRGIAAELAGVSTSFDVLPDDSADGQVGPGWSDSQRAQALRLLEETPWGDVANGLFDLQLCLERAIAATEDSFSRWDEVSASHGSPDEFMVTDELARSLRDDERLAYIAQLVRTAYGALGVGQFGEALSDGAPVEVLRKLLLTADDLHVE